MITCSRETVREFKRRGVRPEVSCAAGEIICVSSVHEVIPWAGHVNYAVSKGGVMRMMKSIAQEVAPYRIRVNSIAPGAIRTAINLQAWDTPEHYAELLKLIPDTTRIMPRNKADFEPEAESIPAQSSRRPPHDALPPAELGGTGVSPSRWLESDRLELAAPVTMTILASESDNNDEEEE